MYDYEVNTIFEYLLCLAGTLWKVQGSRIVIHSIFINCQQASKSFVHARIFVKITLSKEAIVNSTSFRELNKLSEMKSATASILNVDRQKPHVWTVGGYSGGGEVDTGIFR